MIKPPYGDFLLKMGFDKDSMEQVFKKMFGNDTTLRYIVEKEGIDTIDSSYYIYVRDSKRDQKYYEKGLIDKSKKTRLAIVRQQ